MSIQLPDPVATFFKVGNGADSSLLTHCFVDDASVQDEGHAYRGHEAIQSWLQRSKAKYEYSAEPLNVSQQDASVTVIARVTGNFPGSPVQLEYVFHLLGNQIESLEIR